MTLSEIHQAVQNLLKRVLGLIVGLSAAAAAVLFVAWSDPMPGVLGEVARHNLAEDIDATTLLYTEHEGIHDLEEDLRAAKESFKLTQARR